jgi:eukaryotic-like serine/threonine-protein kinase
MTDPLAHVTIALTGRYRIEREVGRGGMATVYLAEDERHHRKVAIKVLHPELSAILGPDRFLKEIELTASLQHPHILPLFDSGSADGHLYYVMPYVVGESLRARLLRDRQLPLADALRIATEVADALEYAHQRGVIHRDIKPENILLHGGHSLVADFGIALAVQQASGERLTQTGLSLGTPQYMSPEQTMGEREVGPRSDVYSLGVVMYEMLIGEPPFVGPTAQAIVAKMMTEDPRRLIPQRRTIPPAVEDAVLTALDKLPADRFASASAFAQALARPGAGHPRPRRNDRSLIAYTAPALALVVVAFVLGRGFAPVRSPVASFGHSVQVTGERGLHVTPALSPDGRSVAYAAGTSLHLKVYVRQVTGGRATQIVEDSLSDEANPSWSPDGSRILFLSKGSVYSAPASGGLARPEVPPVSRGPVISAVWARDGQTIAYAVGDSVYIRNAAGQVRPLAMIPDASLCQWSPSGDRLACSSQNSLYSREGQMFDNRSPSRITIARVSDGAVSTVTDSVAMNQSPVWSPDGRWLYFVSDRLGPRDMYAVRITRAGAANGSPVRLTTGLNAHTITASATGERFAYDVYTATANVWSLPFPPNGATEAQATPVTDGMQVIEEATASSDGNWLFYDSNVSGTSLQYRQRVPNGNPEQLSSGPNDDFYPNLSPDGREVAFHSFRSGVRQIFVMPLDGGPVQQVTSSRTEQKAAPAWSPDGMALTYSLFGVPGGGVWVVRRNADRTWKAPVQRTTVGSNSAWSPDGRWIAYTTNVFGGALAIVNPDSGAPRIIVDPASGVKAEQPLWSRDSRTIYFKSHDARGNAQWFSVPLAGGRPVLLTRFTDPLRPSYRPLWALGPGRMYFTLDERQSEVWVMDAIPR